MDVDLVVGAGPVQMMDELGKSSQGHVVLGEDMLIAELIVSSDLVVHAA